MAYIDSVNVYPSCITLKKGNWYYDVEAIVACSNDCCCRNVRWYSDNSSIASVNASTGYIYANGVGTTKIYVEATDGSECKDYITVIVTESEVCDCDNDCDSNCKNDCDNDCDCTCDCNGLTECVKVTPSSKTMTVGSSDYLHVFVYVCGCICGKVRWSSSDTSVVTVNPYGLVLAHGVGTAVITAAAIDGSGKYDTCVITVKEPIYVDRIDLSSNTLVLYKGNTHKLIDTLSPENASDKRVRWCSSNTRVATVNSITGTVKAVSAGRAIIYATATDRNTVSAKCTVTVKQPTVCCPNPAVESRKVSESTYQDPIDMYSGAHTLHNTLMNLFGGQGIQLNAEYDSSMLLSGDLGVGWHHNFEKRIEIDGNEAMVYSSPAAYSSYVSEDGILFTCTARNKRNYVLSVNAESELPYSVNCNNTKTEYYDTMGRIAKIVSNQGFETVITYSDGLVTITDSVSSKKLYLEKNEEGKVVRVYDDNSRQANLTYSNGMLTAICNANGNTLSYTYNEEGQILTGTDSTGVCYFTNTYDDTGRVVTQKDGITGSMTSSITYEEDGKRIAVDRNGNTSIRVFDDNGSLISFTDENGNTKTYEYDDYLNVICETDSNGNSITKEYDEFNRLTVVTDKNGNKTYFEYDAKGNLIKITHPKIAALVTCETFEYNERNQMTKHTDTRGTVTIFTYDVNGMPQTTKVGSRNAVQYSYVNGLLISQTDAMGNTTQYRHNALGQLIGKTDANNNSTTYEYDSCGNLLKTTDAQGHSVLMTYDGNNQKTSVTDANGNKTEYTYNGNMKNILTKLPDGNTISCEYDGEDRPVKMINQAGSITTVQYDNIGRKISEHFADGGYVNYEYDAVGNVIKETNSKGAVILKTYDANGNVLSVKDNAGNITRNQYNALGKVTRSINAMSGATIYEYSAAGDLICETDPLGGKKVYTYDMYGNILSVRDARGNITTYTYDDNNNRIAVKDAMNNTTTYTYNALNQLVSVKDANNNTITYGYDALGRRITITDAKNNVFTTMYDGNGNVIKTIDAKGNTVQESTYNSLNLPAIVTDSAGNTTNYTYTALGKVASVTDTMNHRKEYGYDFVGRNTSVRDANNNLSTLQFDAMGNVTKIEGPLGGSTNYTYDEMGRRIAETTSSGGIVTYGYNEFNLKEQIVNARDQIKKFFYDTKGRIIGYVGEDDSVSCTYDANGNIVTVTDKNGKVSREYDALNRVTKYTDTNGNSIGYEYDAVGNLTRLIYPDNTYVSYAYDANNNLITVTDWANRVTAYTYDANNRVVGVVKPSGSSVANVYDNKQRIVSSVEKISNNVIISGFEYIYDNLSRIVEERHLAEGTKLCYIYDSLDRVTKRTVYNAQDEVISEENYTYDAAGNVTADDIQGFSYDTNNRLSAYAGNPVTYDMDGNMLNDGENTYEYDSSNRLVKAGEHTYTYTAEAIRIRDLCSEYDTSYVYNTNSKLSQLLVKITNGVKTKYVYGRGLIGEETQDGEFKTYHFDYRGSTVAITDINGNVIDTFKYDTYGKVIEHIGDSNVIFGYNGRDGVVTEKNDLIYMRARYYSLVLRRFINADIIPGAISNAITLNRYAYANGNPVSNIDPFGLSVERGQTYYSVSWQSISGSVGNDTASASGGLYAGTAYAGLMDKGLGVEAGISGATAEGNLTLGNLSLDGEANALAAEANAEFLYEDGFKLGAEAKASVATAEAAFTVDLWLFEIEIGANADFLSAGAEASVIAGQNDDGKFEIGAEAGMGALLFGFGLDISLIFG